MNATATLLAMSNDCCFQVWPKHRLTRPAQHPAGTVVGCVEMLENFWLEVRGDERALAAHDNPIDADKASTEGKVSQQLWRPASFVLREASVHQLNQFLAQG